MKLGIANNLVGRAVERRQVLSDIGDVPTAGYSVRKLTAGYTGPCVKVRRFDGSEQDFGFLGEDLDTTSLLRFVKNEDAPLPVDRGDAVGAYSVRKVSSTYTGSVVKVRRTVSAVTVEADVAFDDADTISLNSVVTITSGTSSATTLGEFVANAGYTDVDSLGGAQDAFVAVWYDQSGGGNHASQSTAGSQPKIVSSGALVTENGKVALDFDGVNDSLEFLSTGGVERSVFITLNTQLDTVNRRFILLESRFVSVFDNSGYNIDTRGDLAGDPIRIILLNDSITTVSYNNPILGYSTISGIISQGSASLYIDGSAVATLSGSSMDGDYTDGVISGYVDASFQEVIIYNTDKSSTRASIEDEINQYYSIYTEAVKDGFVTTWYDQSGSGYHATQATAASQPKIVSAGTLVTENGKVALDFDGSDDRLYTSSTVSITQPFTLLTVSSTDVASASGGLFSIADSITSSPEIFDFYRIDNGFAINSGATLTSAPSITFSPNTQYLKTSLFNSSSSKIYSNASEVASGDSGATNPSGILILGSYGISPFFLNGVVQELTLYSTDKSSLRTAIEDNINAYFNIY